MALEKYLKKRKFNKTTEPQGFVKNIKGKNRFVVQEHHASHLHYDFRLELPEEWDKGSIVLKSWAVPKGVPTEKEIKHLAIAVEDHPVDYINFKGIIPEGNYGAGEVKIWDSGKFKNLKINKSRFLISRRITERELEDDSPAGLEFELVGKKLKGDYVMIKTNFAGNKNSWLMFKK